MWFDFLFFAQCSKNGRRVLASTKQALTTHGLLVSAKHRKRELYSGIATDLKEVQVIRANERRLRDALEDGDYPLAIELCVACREALRSYDQLTALSSFRCASHTRSLLSLLFLYFFSFFLFFLLRVVL